VSLGIEWRVIGQNVLVEGLVPGVVVGVVWWSSLKQIASPQPGMVPEAWWV